MLSAWNLKSAVVPIFDTCVHVDPALLDFAANPDNPPTITTLLDPYDIQYKSDVVPLVLFTHVVPLVEDVMMRPPAPTAVTLLPVIVLIA